MLVTRGNITQFNPGAAGKAGVQAEYVDREGDRIVHPFAEWMSFRPKLQVFGSVVRALSVDVMDVFVSTERSSKSAFHDQSVFIDGLPLTGDRDRPNDPRIAGLPLNVPPGFTGLKALNGFSPLVRPSAGLRTEPLLSDIDARALLAGRFVDVNVPPVRGAFAAFRAVVKRLGGIALLRSLTPALPRTVRRVFAELLPIRAYMRCAVFERLAAICALKTNHLCHHHRALLASTSVIGVSLNTGTGGKLLRGIK